MNSKVLKVVGKGKIALTDEALPAVGRNQMRVRTTLSLISPGTERAFILNLPNTTAEYEFASGYAATAVVEEVGADVTAFRPGDRISNFGIGHRDYAVVDADGAVKIPDNVTDEQAVFGALGIICMQGVRKARIELGESVAVFGCGPIGLLAMMLAKAAGAGCVISVDRAPNRLALARRCGADCTADNATPEGLDDLYSAAPGGANVVIEATGFPDAINDALRVCARYGRVVFLGSTRGETTINVYRDIHKKGLTLIGAHAECAPLHDNSAGFWTRKTELVTFVNLMASGRVDPTPLITNAISKADIVDFYMQNIVTWNLTNIGTVIKW